MRGTGPSTKPLSKIATDRGVRQTVRSIEVGSRSLASLSAEPLIIWVQPGYNHKSATKATLEAA